MTSLLLPPPQSNLHVPQIITHFSLDKTRVTITMPLFSGFPLFSLKKFPNFSSISRHFGTFFPQWFKTTNDVHVYLMLYQTKYCTETRMHSSRMRTVRSLPYRGLPNRDPPGQRPPQNRPPRKWPPGQRSPPPRQRPPPGQRPPTWTETPQTPLGHVTCGACWDRDPSPTESQTGVKTLPCRNFVAGGNN